MKVYLFRSLTIAAVMAASLMSFSAEARKIKTKHSVPKISAKQLEAERSAEETTAVSILSDSVAFCDRIAPAIRFYGFDKTVGSAIESFFISNGLDTPICGMEIEITYTDMKGRQLHKRSVAVNCDLPPGETKRVDIRSWDTQKSFYFHKSVKPKRQATPFDTSIRLLSVTILQ